MRHLKMLGLAVVAAVALIAMIGPSSVSATVLCKTTPVSNSCPSGSDYPAETTIDLSVEGTIHWVAGFIDDTCTKGTAKGKTSNTGSATATVSGPIEALTFEECTCSTTTISKGSLEIHWISGSHNGTLTGKSSEWTTNCSGVTCTYGTAANGTDLGKVTSSATGSSAATVDIEATLPKLAGSFLCPSTEAWNGSYLITEPIPLYVAETA